jgi:hypothetical protein
VWLVPRAALIVFLAVLIELVAYAAVRVLDAKGYVYRPPVIPDNIGFDEADRVRDPLLGWPYREGMWAYGGDSLDESGARPLPAFPDPKEQPDCVVAYGDSFTYGEHVADHAAIWSNRLAEKLGCRVANRAIPGYGTDQSLLRFRSFGRDQAPVVILGHYSDDIRRNLNRDRELITKRGEYLFKPRFVLDESGQLELVPLPHLTMDEWEHVSGRKLPILPLEHEAFQPGSPYVSRPPSFPYLLYLVDTIFREHMLRARIAGLRPYYVQFYQPGHPAHALEITHRIMQDFSQEVKALGDAPLILLEGDAWDIEDFERYGEWSYAPLMQKLDEDGIEYLNFTQYLLDHMQGDRDSYFVNSHYSARGHALLADALEGAIRRMRSR